MELLKGKTAIVYGGRGKLGSAIAAGLHDHGANVAIHYFSNSAHAESLAARLDASGVSVMTVRADSTDEASLTTAVAAVQRRFGTVDIVVNAIHGPFEPVNVYDSAQNDWNVHLNGLMSEYLTSRTALPVMRAQGGGRIIYISAAMAVRYGEGCAMYTAIKRGMNGFCRTLAMEEARHIILVNIVCPGGVSDAETQSGGDWDEMTKAFIARCPLGRFATSQEIANTVVYFASPLADGITGQTLYVSGGEIML